MEFISPNLNIARLRRKYDISDLTMLVTKGSGYSLGRLYMLWKNGHYIVIQAEPWYRPDTSPSLLSMSSYDLEEARALCHIQEVIRAMLDTIVIDGEHNWAHLVRLKDNTYRLVYKKRQLVRNCQIWTKVVEVDEIEISRLASGLNWEGTYQGREVDLFIAWCDLWGLFVAAESRGHKLVESRGVAHHFFTLEAHVSNNGQIIGIMKEPLVGRPITMDDRSAVFEAVADIQQHGIVFLFDITDIYITKRGVRFASASSAKYYRDGDELAKQAKCMWTTLVNLFNHMDTNPLAGILHGTRGSESLACAIIPRLPSPGRPISMRPEDAIIHLQWTVMMNDSFIIGNSLQLYYKLMKLDGPLEDREPTTRRGKRKRNDRNIHKKVLLPQDEFSSDTELSITKVDPEDRPLLVYHVPCQVTRRHHPYVRIPQGRLLLAPEFDS